MSTIESKSNCSGDYPKLWRITYSVEYPVRKPDGFGETMEKIIGQFDVIALTAGLAMEAYRISFHSSVYTQLSGPYAVCVIDAAVGVSKNYGSHFS